MGDIKSRYINSGNKETTRMDQDNEKNVATPKAGANREGGMRVGRGAEDIDERKRNELATTSGDDDTDLAHDTDTTHERDKPKS